MKPTFIDHIVLIVKDIKQTEQFYSLFLGKPEVMSKYYVYYMIGNTKIFFILPYKKIPKNVFQSDRIGLNHIAFGMKTVKEIARFEKILDKAKIKHSGIKINKYSKKEYIWFDDPDKIRVEFFLR